MNISIQGLEDHIKHIVAEALDGLRLGEDPWYSSRAAAEYMSVSVQRVHDLTCTGLLPRHGEKGERLAFRRSELDAYMEARGRRS